MSWLIVATRVPPGPDGRVFPADVIGTWQTQQDGQYGGPPFGFVQNMVAEAAYVSFTRQEPE